MIIVNYKHYDDVRDRGIRYIQDTYEHKAEYIGLRTEDNKPHRLETTLNQFILINREEKLKRILK